jgi:DNA-binding GntR family transcriptional regulator
MLFGMPASSTNQATDLTDFVEQDLKARLLSGTNLPEKLTLAGISEHYGVSMTPIRIAVGNLIQAGILEKLDNGQLGIGVKPARSAKPKAVLPPPSASDWNLRLLKEVMMASLGAEGVYLREEAMARKYGVGRAVIRQTFGRLASPGLLEHVPRCGWRVSPIDHEKVRSFLQVREAMELTALDLAWPSLQTSVLRYLLDRNREIESHRSRIDSQLHEYWIEKSSNIYIQAFFKQHTTRYHSMLFNHAAPEIEVAVEMAGQHCGILEALLARKLKLTKSLLSEHIWTQARVLGDFLSRRTSSGSN